MFRRFFAEGAFNMAFVPMFAKKLEAGEDAEGLCPRCLWGMAGLLTVFSVLAISRCRCWSGDGLGLCRRRRFDLAVDAGPDRLSLYPVHLADRAAVGMLNAHGPVRRHRQSCRC
jgi:putative peptidoglycan lipid II flippase